MSVELALRPFPARWRPTSRSIADACELHAGGFDSAPVPLSFFPSVETLS